jgi:hypothetical protein
MNIYEIINNNDDVINRIIADEDFMVKTYRSYRIADDNNIFLAKNIRIQRDMILLNIIDPIISNTLRWNDLTVEKQKEWSDYRRAILDITSQPEFPVNVIWPTKPA